MPPPPAPLPPWDPHSPSGQSSCFRAKCTSERHTWGRGWLREGTRFVSPSLVSHRHGDRLTSTQLPRTCTGSSSASSPGAEPSGCKAHRQSQCGAVSPCPPQPSVTHPCDSVEGGFRLALPTPVLAEGCAEGCCGDTRGEVQAQLQPPDAHRDVPCGLCSHQRETWGGGCEMPEGMRGARNLGTGLCSSQGCPPPTELTRPVGTLHVAAVSIGELAGSRNQWRVWVSCHCPPLPPNPFPGSAQPSAGSHPKAELGMHVHFVQHVRLEWAESASPSPTHTAHGHPSTCPPPS